MSQKTLLLPFVSLYFVALVTSMAAMEILSWAIFLIVITGIKQISLPKAQTLLLPILLWGWAVLTTVVNGFDSQSTIWAIGDFRWVLLLMAFYSVEIQLLSSPKIVGYLQKWLFPVLLFVIGVVASYGVFQHYYGVDFFRGEKHKLLPAVFKAGEAVRWRSTGFFSLPLTYAYSMSFVLFFLFPFLFYFKGRQRFYFGTVVTLLFFAVYGSFTRGAWLALIITAPIVLFWLLPWKKVLMVIVASVSIFLTTYTLNSSIQTRVDSIFDLGKKSNADRIILWKTFYLMFEDSPFFGVGFNVKGLEVQEYLKKQNKKVSYPGHAHNNFMQFLGVSGLVGAILYLFLSLYFLHRSFLLINSSATEPWLPFWGIGLFGAQLAFHIGGITECNFFDEEVRHLLVLSWATSLVLLRYAHHPGSPHFKHGSWSY